MEIKAFFKNCISLRPPIEKKKKKAERETKNYFKEKTFQIKRRREGRT